ncbi:MAG: ribulose-phosphate 3-epimerase [Acidobacteriota bacterium]
MKLAPSLLAADLADIAGALDLCARGGVDALHFDVMDGHFVPNLSFGLPVLRATRARTSIPLDVHLMIANPGRLLDDYLDAGADWLTVHWETADHLDGMLSRIRARGARAGVALNPSTPVELLDDVLHQVDHVLIMSVNPGFGGQRFLPHTLDKVRRLRQRIAARALRVEIQMDGGLDRTTAPDAVAAGVDIVVAGSAIFGADDPLAAIRALRAAADVDTPT